jgi:glyoxylase-like metal-dependent hydrolase (beta-lactamase superfamily II)
LEDVGLGLEQLSLLVCTHGHVDHCGQAAALVERTGCELWMHDAIGHATEPEHDREGFLARRVEIAQQCGVPAGPLARWAAERSESPSGMSGVPKPDRMLADGDVVDTEVGAWKVIETPGHAPSHLCFYNEARDAMISGDHLTGRVALYFEHGWSPDPVGQYLESLERTAGMDARIGLAGHGKPFIGVNDKIDVTRGLVLSRIERVAAAVAERPRSVFELRDDVFGEEARQGTSWVGETLCYLEHLEQTGRASRADEGVEQQWRAAPA